MDLKDLFESGTLQYHAAVLNSGEEAWDTYATGYRTAAELLVQQLNDSIDAQLSMDTLVYPIVFLYRQYLELRLKQLILKYSRFLDVEIDPNIRKCHKVDQLWNKLNPILKSAFDRYENHEEEGEEWHKFFSDIEEFIKYFNELDPSSFNFRYPVDTGNQPTLADKNFLAIGIVAQKVRDIGAGLDGASIQIDVWQDMLSDAYSGGYNDWNRSNDTDDDQNDELLF